MSVTRRALLRQMVAAADVSTLSGGFVFAHWLDTNLFGERLNPFGDYLWLLWVIVWTWVFCLGAFGLYRSDSYCSAPDLLGRLCRAQAVAGLILLAVMYTTHSVGVSRLLIGGFLAISFVLLNAQKLAVMRFVDGLRRSKSSRRQNVLLIGSPEHAAAYMERQGREVSLLADVVGLLIPPSIRQDDGSGR